MKVMLVEPWMGGSHGQWAEGFAAASNHEVQIIGLPANGWRWRLRASAPRLAEMVLAEAKAGGAPDAFLVSGLTDTASLLGLLPFRAPTVTFMHESQIAYPTPSGSFDVEGAATNLRSWLASDEVWFNSAYHLDTVCNALPALRSTLPAELWPNADPADRFRVMSLGVDLGWVDAGSMGLGASGTDSRAATGPPAILWPHRWQSDKNPDVFLAALRRLDAAGLPYRLVLAGEDGPKPHPAKVEILNRFVGADIAVGPFNVSDYRKQVNKADLVVSCADHEFFGVGVVEAVAAGCRPVLPRALSYPEVIPEPFHQQSLYEPGTFGTALEHAVRSFSLGEDHPDGALADAMHSFSWAEVAPRYDDALSRLAKDQFGH